MEENKSFQFSTIEEALDDLRAGKIILCTDDPDRENEGDFICAAQFATTENVNFMAVHGKGLICMPMSAELCQKLAFPQMVTENTDNHETAFTVSIDHVDTTTGISAQERGLTARAVVQPGARPSDFRRPGHMFPLMAKANGVLERNGHTEATVDLMRLAGLEECGLCCEIMREDGTMMRTPELIELARQFNLKFISIKALQDYRKKHECHVVEVADTAMPTRYGAFRAHAFVNKLNGEHHVAPGERRHRRRRRCAGARSFRVPHRRCLRQPALRLRPAAGCSDGPGGSRGARGGAVHAPGRARHRACEQAARLRAARCRHGYPGGQPGPGASRATCENTTSAPKFCTSWA